MSEYSVLGVQDKEDSVLLLHGKSGSTVRLPVALVVAADDLLETLKALLDYAENGTPIQPGALIWDEAREAIAAAKYESRD